MKIRLYKNKCNPTLKGRYINEQIAMQFVDIGKGIRAFNKKKYAKSIRYLEKKALDPKSTERIKYIIGASYTECKIHEKEAADLLKSIIQKYKDEPRNKRPKIYSNAILEYAKIQLRNELIEFAIYLLEDITIQNDNYNIDVLTELAIAYDRQGQVLRKKEKYEEANEIEKKAENLCLKCKELSKEKSKEAVNVLGILYTRQGKIEEAKREFKEINWQNEMNTIDLLKKAYFEEETEEDVNKRIKRIEQKLEAIERGEIEQPKEYARELNVVSRTEYYEELSLDLKVSNGIDVFTGYKMYEYPSKGIILIDKMFSDMKQNKKVIGATYVFHIYTIFELEKLARTEIIRMLEEENKVQKQEHKGDYYNLMQEKMKRAELECLVIEEKELKEKEEEIARKTKEKIKVQEN